MPPGVDGPWDWPQLRRSERPIREHRSALTVAPAWGVSAAPRTSGPLGRPGPWAEEAAAVERAYGSEETLHASLEEFARTLTTHEEARERLREGGVRSRLLDGRLGTHRARAEREEFLRSFRRFRAFDRPNVAHLFAGFSPSRRFAREFPEAVETGPLWPARFRRRRGPGRGPTLWLWYASPASSEAIVADVAEGLRRSGREVRLTVRSPRPWRSSPPHGVELRTEPVPAARWRREFSKASLRIVTGSRSLLDALELGGPFLYFNGVLGTGPSRRRHRPEKLVAFLAAARGSGWPAPLCRDLADFARGRRVREIVGRAARREGPWGRWPPLPGLGPYPTGRSDLGELLVRIAGELASAPGTAPAIVARLRERSWP